MSTPNLDSIKNKGSSEKEEQKFQQYKSARPAVCVITDTGIKIKFAGYEYLTTQEAEIEYLDKQIKIGGLPGITKGELLTMEERDPMAALERKIRKELEEKYAQKAKDDALGISRDMGKTEGANKLNPVSSKQVVG